MGQKVLQGDINSEIVRISGGNLIFSWLLGLIETIQIHSHTPTLQLERLVHRRPNPQPHRFHRLRPTRYSDIPRQIRKSRGLPTKKQSKLLHHASVPFAGKETL